MNRTTPVDMAVLAFWFLIAAGVATLLRLMDYPSVSLEKDNMKVIVETFIGALLSAIVGAKLLGTQLLVNGDISMEGLIVIISLSIGGMTALRALISQVKAQMQEEEE